MSGQSLKCWIHLFHDTGSIHNDESVRHLFHRTPKFPQGFLGLHMLAFQGVRIKGAGMVA
jgi:hypothetical protein